MPIENKEKSIQNGLHTLFEGLNNIIDQEAAQKYEQVKDILKIDISSPEKFYFNFAYPVEQVISTLVKQNAVHKEELCFLYRHYSYVNAHFRELFSRLEGGPCCADKSGTMIWVLTEYFKTGQNIELDYKQEYTFHLPNKILKTHDDILEYFNAIWALYYGNPDKYLKQTLKLANCIKNEEDPA